MRVCILSTGCHTCTHTHTPTSPDIEKHSHPSFPLSILRRYIYNTLLSLLIVIVLLFLRSFLHTQRPHQHPTHHSSRTVNCLTTRHDEPDQTISPDSPYTGTADRYHETRYSDHHRCDHAHTTHSHTCTCTCMNTPLVKKSGNGPVQHLYLLLLFTAHTHMCHTCLEVVFEWLFNLFFHHFFHTNTHQHALTQQ